MLLKTCTDFAAPQASQEMCCLRESEMGRNSHVLVTGAVLRNSLWGSGQRSGARINKHVRNINWKNILQVSIGMQFVASNKYRFVMLQDYEVESMQLVLITLIRHPSQCLAPLQSGLGRWETYHCLC